ncbi:hypothetical protein DFJ43DRAFT_1068249, partial [Lentinula guzmanii]
TIHIPSSPFTASVVQKNSFNHYLLVKDILSILCWSKKPCAFSLPGKYDSSPIPALGFSNSTIECKFVMKFNFNFSLSVFNSKPASTRSVDVVRFLFLINGLLLFAAATTALPHGPRNVDDIDSSSQPVHWQPAALVSRAKPRPKEQRTWQATVRFMGSYRDNIEDDETIAETLVGELLDLAASVLDRTRPDTDFIVAHSIGYPTKAPEKEYFTVSFTMQGPKGPEIRVYQGWFSWEDEDKEKVSGEIRSSGVNTLVAKIEKGKLTYPKPS